MRLNLERVPEALRARAERAFEERDLRAMLGTIGTMISPFFIFDNLSVLKEFDLLERAVIAAWVNTRASPVHDESVFPILFAYADRGKLRACGDTLPGSGPFVLYRSCAGKGRVRNVRGYSWTGSYVHAQWLVKQLLYRLPDPAVYRIEAPEAWILAYLNQSFAGREEFLVSVPYEAKVIRVWMEGQ